MGRSKGSTKRRLEILSNRLIRNSNIWKLKKKKLFVSETLIENLVLKTCSFKRVSNSMTLNLND